MNLTTEIIEKANAMMVVLQNQTQGPEEAMALLLLMHLAMFKTHYMSEAFTIDEMLTRYCADYKALHAAFGASIEKPKPTILGPDGKPLQ